MRLNPYRAFVISTVVILAFTGIAKIFSALGKSKVLTVVDPILGVEFGHLILLVGVVEITIALVLLLHKETVVGNCLVALLATNFVVYRLGLWWINWNRPCGCLGNLMDAIHISPQIADTVMKCVLAYLLIGSYASLVSSGVKHRSPVHRDPLV